MKSNLFLKVHFNFILDTESLTTNKINNPIIQTNSEISENDIIIIDQV